MIVNGVDTERLARVARLLRSSSEATATVTLTLPASQVADWLMGESLHAEHARLGANMPGLGMAAQVADHLMTKDGPW